MDPLPSTKKAPWIIISTFVGLSLVIALAGVRFYSSGKSEIKRNIENDLWAIANLKVRLIETWRQERLADATVIRDNQFVASRVDQWLATPSNTTLAGSLLIWMAALQRENGYQSVLLLDSKGRPRLGTQTDDLRDRGNQLWLDTTLRSRRVVFSDLFRTQRSNRIYIDLYTPLVKEERNATRVVGILVLRIDPYQFLYPLIQTWPTPSRSAETLIVRREGDKILFLSELRHRKASPLTFVSSVHEARLPAAEAARGKEGVVEGIDYRGVPVLAAVRAIPESPWIMVSKIDTEEVYAPIRQQAWVITIVATLLIGIAGSGVSFWWKHQTSLFYRRQLAVERDRQELAQRAEEERSHLLARERAARLEAEAANRMKDEFLATVSHELRTPLNPILGWACTLRAGGVDPETANEALATIERNARIQSQLIEDLLDTSRIISGKLHLEVQPIHLRPVIEAAVDNVRLAAQAKRITLLQDLSPQSPLVAGDARRLQQVLGNLLSNAVKFTPGGGRIVVLLTATASQVEVSVADSGKGIPPNFLPHVFDRFRQEDSSLTRKFGGLGLGLAISKHLVELHGGRIQAESAGEGCGATFTIQLPTLAASSPGILPPDHPAGLKSFPAVTAPEHPSPDLRDLRILVVEDEEDCRNLLAKLLGQRGCLVRAVASAEAALATLASFAPEILISDIGMPDADGYSLIQTMRKKCSHVKTRLGAIALTAHARSEDREQALAAGFDRHLAKPLDPTLLLSAVSELVARWSQSPEAPP